ncbi:Disease resistance protein TIR-NBS-LRR class family [Prunus dulcis]|uniref:Disease resistance protein TIR-NBS-LRR class family n=1 Tax=Prunus dulcis TaxID=3755 RepID=A0A4Y1QVZ9_PRUDU|nr:Disease resistance protein TIR-NBS-LRR class family [Prunus dulcis]
MRTSIEAPSSRTWKYQVFLSFRGEDTRKGFTGHLYAALSDAGIHAFLDYNELKRAEFIKNQLQQAIHGSMISIIVFSKRYADSSWCLDELVKIMECRERLEQKVFPLFYNVDASDVRNQTGSFAQSFEKHEAGICEGKHEKEKVQQWKNALTQAADLCGDDLKNADNGHEAKFIKKILGEVNKQLYRKYQLDIEHLVGITSRVNNVVRMIDIEKSGSKDVVRMIGIWGMGGIGKTTLAKAIYNKFEGSFEGRSFLANVREVIANQPITGLVGLQEKLLNDILKSKDHIKVDSVDVGITVIQERLHCKRALVIIDDVDEIQKLKAIARKRDWFGPGSRIIITTRDKHLLEQIGVDGTYMAEEMDEEEALELFSWHAFKSGYPDQEYLYLSKRVIRYCRGLPLALEVMGSFLIKRTALEWESQLERLERSPHEAITKVLRISFDGLPHRTDRSTFLDISCFFIGMDKDYVTQILDGCGFSATLGIPILIERCLVTVSEQNKLMMHDLLRDMGREIVYENADGHPENFSRLWKREDVTDVLSDESGTEKIEVVALDLDLDLTRFSAQAFTNMKKLRLLLLTGVELTGEYKDFPKNGANSNSLEGLQAKKITRLFKTPKSRELILRYCVSLSEVHSSIGDLGRLSLVNLEGCRTLEDLPLNFYQSKSIETLILNKCRKFVKLAEGLGDMVSLTTLEAGETAIRQIPSSILKLKKLKALSLCYVKGWPSTNLLPLLQSLSSLRELALANCSLTDDGFPKDLGNLISLENLDLASNDFCSLPSLSLLSQLQDLTLHDCIKLRAIPDLPTNLKVLKADDCIALEKMPDFSEMSNIRELYLRNSGKITEIPGLDKSLNSMTRIHMENCTNLTAILGRTSYSGNDIPDWFHCVHDDDIVYFTVPQSDGRNLKGLTLSFGFSSSSERFSLGFRISIKNMTKCTELEARIIPDCPIEGYYLWQGQLSNEELKLQDGDKVWIEIIVDKWAKVKKTGVILVWDKFMNENMIDYHLCAYERRAYLVNDDDIIHVENDNHITKSPDFSKFPNLEKLILKDCPRLSKVHSSIGDLGRLSLLAEGLGDMASLTILSLSGCSLTEDAIPKDLCSLISLEHLLLGANYFRSLPSLAGLSKLRVLCLNACRSLRAIPDLPTNLYVLKANGCPKLETIPDFSKMSNMRELYLSDSFELAEIPGLDKSLNSMTRIHMEGCTNLTADFRNSILQRWTSCGFGGIYLNGIYDIPEWFKIVNDVDNIVFFEVPQRIMGRDLKGLTICFVYSSRSYSHFPEFEDSQECLIGIIVRNLTKQTALHTKIAFASFRTHGRLEHLFWWRPEDHYLWQGQLSNDVLRLQGGDQVSILVRPLVDFVRVKKTGVHLEWDKVMNENMDNPDPHLYDWETNGDFLGGVDESISRNCCH